jgi:energy-coupling factor transport system ATP-binding protein
METIRRLNREQGITIILITHYMEEAAQSDRIVVMDGGKVLLDDVPKRVFSQVETLKSVGLDVPQVTELAHLLRQEGIPIAEDIIHTDECIAALAALLDTAQPESR